MELDLDSHSRYRPSEDRRAFSSYLDAPRDTGGSSSAGRLYDKYRLDKYSSTSYSATLNCDEPLALSGSYTSARLGAATTSSSLLGTRHLEYRPSSNLDASGATANLSSLYRPSTLIGSVGGGTLSSLGATGSHYHDSSSGILAGLASSERDRIIGLSTFATNSTTAAAATTTTTTTTTTTPPPTSRPSGVYFSTTTTSLGGPLAPTTISSYYAPSAGAALATTTAASSYALEAHSSARSAGRYSSALDKLITPSSSSINAYRDPLLRSSSPILHADLSSSRYRSIGGVGKIDTTTTTAATTTSTTTTTTSGRLYFGESTAPSSAVGLSNFNPKSATGPASRAMRQSNLGAKVVANPVLQQMFDDMRLIEDTVDSIEIPARGRCKVFMAKYGYDPFKESPNEEADKELAFNAGDYIMVFTDLDEDGYFIGELMDGRRGYVPSNWLERLTGEDLFEFQATVLYKQQPTTTTTTTTGGKHLDSSTSASRVGTNLDQFGEPMLGVNYCGYPADFYDLMLADSMGHSNNQHLLAPEDYHRMNDYVDLDDVNEVDDECLSDYERAEAEQMRRAVPPPQRLTIERQLHKSILVSWLHPQAAKGTIVSYQIYVDGVLKSTVPRGDRTKALLEGVDSSIPHRISVRALDYSGAHSSDAACTLVIGQKIPFAPSCVKASHITSDSALISWLPCNSNFQHVVAVNSVEVQTVRPGAYKHLINGLSADTLYRVWVRAKPGKILACDEKNPKKLESLTTFVDFKTLAKSLPEPPVNVQVEAGPQRRSLLVTWLPLTLNDYGTSNGCPVTGYAVFAGHKKLADVDSPTGDHALLDLAELDSLHKKSVTVRTKSGENLSQDSMACQIPDEYLKNQAAQEAAAAACGGGQRQHQLVVSRHQQHQQRHSPQKHHGRVLASQRAPSANRLEQQQLQRHPNAISRHLTRSLHNLESDLDSRRSSNPGVELHHLDSQSDTNHQFSINPAAESYSEEEFESSMRLRGPLKAASRQSRMAAARAYRSRQSHSVDSASGLPVGGGGMAQANALNRYQSGSLARLRENGPGQHAAHVGDREIRYFVAQFDYDPATMSPNPNAAQEELAFKEGSIIKVFGDKGLDGFYRGELDNRFGFVPCNVVSEIRDPNLIYQLQEKNRLQQQQQQQQQQQMVPMQMQQQQQQQQQPQSLGTGNQAGESGAQMAANGLKRMIAMYDYDPQENSPNADTESEIAFKKGDIIYVYGKMDTDGFYMGEVERTKKHGLVPSNFLCEDPVPAKVLQQQAGLVTQHNQMDQSFGQVNMQQQQQQTVLKPMNPNQQIRANIRTVQQDQQHQQQQQQTLQANNRLNSMQMGANQQHQGMSSLQQSQQQPMMMGGGVNRPLGANQDPLQQQQQQFLMSNRNQQQQQPQQAGGVLSNLLSSGKQMIGAASTPKNLNQQGQFGVQNQPQMGAISQQNQMVGALNPNQMQLQQQQQQQQQQQLQLQQQQQQQQQQQPMQQVGMAPAQMMQQQQVQANGMIDNSMIAAGQLSQQAQGQPLTRAGLIAQSNQVGQFGQNIQDPMQQQLQLQQQQQQQQLQLGQQQQQMQPANQMRMAMPIGMAMQNTGLQQQQQQQQPLGMGQIRQPQMGQQMGEEQGGTILNTVKNMFKL